MKIDRSRIKKSTSEVPPECQALIEKLRTCSRKELLEELKKIDTWTFGKCELYHWIEILDLCDTILETAAARVSPKSWQISCDVPDNQESKELLLWVLHFTTLLIEHSFSRHLYNSVEHLLTLLSSSDLNVVLGVLNLLYMFSKRSNFITRINAEMRNTLLKCLTYLAESWGGRENGFGLADCVRENSTFPSSGTTLHYEFYTEDKTSSSRASCIHLENVDQIRKLPSEIMDGLVESFNVPKDGHMSLFTHLRLAHSFANHSLRLKCVQARLQALSVLLYSNADSHNLLYPGILDELVQLLELRDAGLVEIRSAALRTLTSIIHLDRSPHLPKKPGSRLNMIIDVTGAGLYHGFLPQLVRSCISSLTNDGSQGSDTLEEQFPLPLATALFSFLYHLASYEAGGEALVSCGMMECLLRVINWPGVELEHITFVTRAVRVIDLITNIDMQSFQSHGGLNSFINRLEMEIKICRQEQPYEIVVPVHRHFQHTDSAAEGGSQPTSSQEEAVDQVVELADEEMVRIAIDRVAVDSDSNPSSSKDQMPETSYDRSQIPDNSTKGNKTCLPQRAALLKSMLNFLKKALQDPAFTESIRHVMDGLLPHSLKHIISNAEYYGPSLFLLATDVVAVYVFQEPSLLSSLQDLGLTEVVLHALLIKEVPATREVLGSVPNVFSALCLNTRGLASFIKYKPFEKLFKVLLSPNYLSAMRRRRSSDPIGDTASNLGNAMDELMRHQPSLKSDAIAAIIRLLQELCLLGHDPKYVCWKPQKGSSGESPHPVPRVSNEAGSSDEEEEDEEEASTSSHPQREDSAVDTSATAFSEKTPVALVDYILNVMKFVDAILSNNSTDDHCREFVNQNGLEPLLSILALPNLPVDYPITPAAQAVASVCKSVLNLAHEAQVMKCGLSQLCEVLSRLSPLYHMRQQHSGSILLEELSRAPNMETAFSTPSVTPLLHAMAAAHGYVIMFVHVCRTGQLDIRTISMTHWGSELGLAVLAQLADLYSALVWESTVLLALCSEDSNREFGKDDIIKICPPSMMRMQSESMDVTNEAQDEPMEVDDEKLSNRAATKANSVIPPNIKLKYIKPLLGASSRLGRALAELFGLLVKLCVGFPVRTRRGNHLTSTPVSPTPSAHNVANSLAALLTRGLSPQYLPDSPVPKFKLTYLICSVGFTQPMLFDEKRYPYHLMLMKFVKAKGQQAFFDTFMWALSGGGNIQRLEEGVTYKELPEGTGEFIDAWLLLLEKMANPKAILESTHMLPFRMAPGGNKYIFHPLKYLQHVHKMAFDALSYLWGRKPFPNYGARITETMLTIYRHIIRGERLIEERKQKESETTVLVNPAASEGRRGGASREHRPEVNPTELTQLMDMGFSREHCYEALILTATLEHATDYLLNNFFPHNVQPSPSTDGEDGEEWDDPLESSALDQFTNEVLKVCLDYVEKLPETVYRVCDLLTIIIRRNGEIYCYKLLNKLVVETIDNVNLLLEQLVNLVGDVEMYPREGGSRVRPEIFEVLLNSPYSVRLAGNLHLLMLLFEEIRVPCAKVVHSRNLVNVLIQLLAQVTHYMREGDTTPKWMAPLLLLIDLLEKVSVCVNRKVNMHKVTTQTWRWLDLASGKWSSYMPNNNKLINEAYWRGDRDVTITSGRRRYTIAFASMCQINDDSGKARPVMMSLMESKDPLSKSNFDTQPTDIPPFPTPITNPEEKDPNDTIESLSEPEYYVDFFHRRFGLQPIEGVNDPEIKVILRCCMELISKPADSDTLHAVLQLCVRFTRDYENARFVAELCMVKELLRLTINSSFTGFVGLATMCIRHILEEPANIVAAIERVIRFKTLPNIPPTFKELHYILRECAPAICRDPILFRRVAKDIMRVDISALNKRSEEDDHRLLMKCLPSENMKGPSEVDKLVKRTVVHLLTFLVDTLREEVTTVDPGLTSSPAGDENDTAVLPTASSVSDVEVNNSPVSDGSPWRGWASPEPAAGFLGFSSPHTTPPNRTRTVQVQVGPGESSIQIVGVQSRSQPTEGFHFNVDNLSISVTVRNNEEPDLDTFNASNLPMYIAATGPVNSSFNTPKKSNPTSQTGSTQPDKRKRTPLLTISNVLKILGDAVRSYSCIAKMITDHKFNPKQTEFLNEECTAIAFVLDYLMPVGENNTQVDPDRPNMARNLLAALASCNHSPEAQCALVSEVKSALSRTVAWPESAKKHTHIQDLVGVVTTMIENCPPVPISSTPLSPALKLNQYSVNNMVRFMMRKGIVTDLARIPHSLDLSSPKMAATINAMLKPLETLSRIMSQPSGQAIAKTKPKPGSSNTQGSDDVNPQPSSAASNQSDTNQSTQMDQSGAPVTSDVADEDNADIIDEHPLREVMNRVVETVNQMEDLMQNVRRIPIENNRIRLERNRRARRGQSRVINQLINPELSRLSSIFSSSADFNTFSNNEETSQDSSSDDSDSTPTDRVVHLDEDAATDIEDPVEEEDDDDDDDEEEEEDDDDDDDDDDDQEGEDNEGEESNGAYDEDGLELFEPDENLFRIPGLDRDSDDFLMIEYSEPDPSAPLGQPWSRESFLPFSLFEEAGNVNSDTSGNSRIPTHHPLLMARQHIDQPTSTSGTRTQRMSRTRRYQYVQMNRAAVAAPVFLQRLMSQNSADPPSYLNIPGHPGPTYNEMLAATFPNSRLIVMDNGLGILTNAEEEQINFVDQSGYLLGPSLAATLNNVPTSMYWWNEELRLLDRDSICDCSVCVGYDLVPIFEFHRSEEFAERKDKRRKLDDEEDNNKKACTSTGDTEKKKLYDGIMDMFESSPRPPARMPTRRIAMLAAAQEVAQATESLAGSIVESVLHPRAVQPPGSRSMLPIQPPGGPSSPPQEPTDLPQLPADDNSSAVVVHYVSPDRSQASSIPEALELIPVAPSLSEISDPMGLIPGSVPYQPPGDPDDGYYRVNPVLLANDRSENISNENRNSNEIRTENGSSGDSEPMVPTSETRAQSNDLRILETLPVDMSPASNGSQFLINSPPVAFRQANEALEIEMAANWVQSQMDSQSCPFDDDDDDMGVLTQRDPISPIPSHVVARTQNSEDTIEQPQSSSEDVIVLSQEPERDVIVLSSQETERDVIVLSSQESGELSQDTENWSQETVVNPLLARPPMNREDTVIEASQSSSEAFILPSQEPVRSSIFGIEYQETVFDLDLIRRRTREGTIENSQPSSEDPVLSSQESGRSCEDITRSQHGHQHGSQESLVNLDLIRRQNREDMRSSDSIVLPAQESGRDHLVSESPQYSPTSPVMPRSLEAATGANPVVPEEIPEGVDPSFLAALPEEMRAEVISEYLRVQRLQNRVLQNSQEDSSQFSSQGSVSMEVNADFLAALPPAIQEEVLTQQRLEQQRQAAALLNPDDPVDLAAFFQDLPHSLRQSILTDMEESQISVLPPELAAEAQNLRREWEARNRQLMQERFLSHVTHSSALSSILRHSTTTPRNIRRPTGPRYTIQNMLNPSNRTHWLSSWNLGTRLLDSAQSGSQVAGLNTSLTNSNLMGRPRGRQVLDYESISCLLVLLFVDDSRLNTARLHRVFRNLCYHPPTREWVIRAILSIMEKSNEGHVATNMETQQHSGTVRRVTRSQTQPGPASATETSQHSNIVASSSSWSAARSGSSWLNISMDAALGCRATVFNVQKNPGRRNDKSITINPQAAPFVYRHALDILISLAKIFPSYFVPGKATAGPSSGSAIAASPPKMSRSPRPDNTSNFWDLLIRLDSLITSKKGKTAARPSSTPTSDPDNLSLESSPFGQLLKMLASPVVQRSPLLMDKLLRLLSLISITLHVHKQRLWDKVDVNQVTLHHLGLAINVLISNTCSEEGLEDATALLLNMTVNLANTRETVLNLLLDGARNMASVVCEHIESLLKELKVLNSQHVQNYDLEDNSVDNKITSLKGILSNRFTKDTVVVTAPKKVKAGLDLQLNSMAPLISKTSSQAFFLRILKVIVQLRESVRNFDKKKRKQAADTANGAEAQSSEPTPSSSSDPSSQEEPAAPSTSEVPMDTSPPPSASGRVNADTGDGELRNDKASDDTPPPLPLPPLSEQLDLDILWNTLSECLTELQHTQDNHAVLVLQPAVEAFFLVHASGMEKSEITRGSGTGDPARRERERLSGTTTSSPPNTSSQDSRSRPLSQNNWPNQASSNGGATTTTTPPYRHLQLSMDGLTPTPPPVSPLPVDHHSVDMFAESPPDTPYSSYPVNNDQNNQQPTNSQNSQNAATLSQSDSANPVPAHQLKFLKFAEKHRTVLNQILRQSTTPLLEGPFAVLVNHTRVLDFDVKRRYFRGELERADEGQRREELAVHVRRTQVFEDSFRELHRRTPDEWKNRFYIVFEGEEGQDAGGLLREWYMIISREIFNPMYALFTTSPGDRVTYMINPSSHCNPNHLCYFKFVGRVIAKAIYDNKLLECYFTRSFYKHILGILVKYTDMESEDYSFYQGLVFLMEHPVDSIGYEPTFSTEVQEFGVTEIRDLIPGGRHLLVTEENKMDYIQLVCQMKMTGAIRKQLNAFLEGFYDIIPMRLISIFNEQELELLISGLPNVDIEDLKANTEYYKYQPNSLQIQWFWRALREFDQAERAKFLQFVTGTSKVPLQGFAALEGMNGVQKFQIHRDERSTDRLPSAHTCFNQLDLPVYETYTKLRLYLLKAIHECSEGFGFA